MAARPKGDPIRVTERVSAGVIKIGDFVTITADGTVRVAAASEALLGVSNSYCSGAGQACNVFDHPDQHYLVAKSSSAPSAQSEFNLNYNIVANSSTNQESAHTLDSSSGATTATLPLRAIDRSRAAVPSNECVVLINNHVSKAGVAGL